MLMPVISLIPSVQRFICLSTSFSMTFSMTSGNSLFQMVIISSGNMTKLRQIVLVHLPAQGYITNMMCHETALICFHMVTQMVPHDHCTLKGRPMITKWRFTYDTLSWYRVTSVSMVVTVTRYTCTKVWTWASTIVTISASLQINKSMQMLYWKPYLHQLCDLKHFVKKSYILKRFPFIHLCDHFLLPIQISQEMG